MRLAAFAGDWLIDRAIEDSLLGRAGRFVGRARFTSAPGGLDYCEDGVLSLGDATCRATRRYHWREASSDAIEIRFADGRLFHSFSKAEPTPTALHDCPPDSYHVRYDFRFWPLWTAEWRVQGPRKAYRTLSTFRRAGQAAKAGA